jgi:hypothetical protein
MKRSFLILFAVVGCCVSGFGQSLVRFGPYEFPSVSSSSSPFLVANLSPNLPTLSVCASPANQVPCTNYATTYQHNGTACPNGAQDVPDPNATTAGCQSTGDSVGNIAFWAPPGQYDITVCISSNCFLYTVSQYGTGSGGPQLIVANASSTGTTLYTLTKLTGAPSTAVVAATSDTGGVVGVVIAGAGTTGNATIQTSGLVNCVFSGGTTAGHYVQISSGTGGDCLDSGASYPTTGQVIGRVLSTNGSAGTYQIDLFPAEIKAPPANGFPSNPQTGDTVCYNCNGDSAWDAVNYARPYVSLYAIEGTSGLYTGGILSGSSLTATVTGSSNTANPTATLSAGNTVSASSTPSTSTVIGTHFGNNGNNSLLGAQSFYRWSYRAAMGNTTNVRYWHGLSCYHEAGGTGNNGAQPDGTTAYATDTPNKSTEGFLYDPAINSHWQAVVVTAGSSSGANTTVDTGVVEDTNIHLWEMTTNTTGTAILFWIDGTNVATISTNLPPPSNNADSWMDLFFTGDNKNTSTAISETFYSMQMSLKL